MHDDEIYAHNVSPQTICVAIGGFTLLAGHISHSLVIIVRPTIYNMQAHIDQHTNL